jgi:hypothetical protein
MKSLILSFSLLLGGSLFSQNVMDSVSVAQLKEEIKHELQEELKADSSLQKSPLFSLRNFSLKGYGVVNYYNYNFDTDPALTDKIDVERLNLHFGYSFTDKISFKSEIEFEHGGTGASIGLDTQEEFGEFDQEIEKGGIC